MTNPTPATGTPGEPAVIDLRLDPVSREAFAPFGDLIEASEDGVPFGAQDARLDLSGGTPRFYIMRLHGKPPVVRRITRHRNVTQCLASVGGRPWFLAVAAPDGLDDPAAEPSPDGIRGFLIPGDVAVALRKGTWHAGPFFEGDELSFFNLELSDTNEVDHHNAHLDRRHGIALRLVPPSTT
ncbi:ureidoglycolate lyase [Arenibaculum pallidiluteum]|uniref:ureidoglycolate lyase n=1 Tax=Arenibaculum pallidiluteum TaxID=2812559 RepID=UPI001A957833|nr:ureidoglycolate lyase [Arenibaculum pallidiluteum]